MRVFHIFWREYWGNISRRSYLIFTFGFPLFMVSVPLVGGLILAVAVQSAMPRLDSRPVGVVDEANLLTEAQERPLRPVEIILFENRENAAEALSSAQIQAYYVIPADYWQTGHVILTYDAAPVESVDRMVAGWLRARIRARVPPDLLTRLEQGPRITHNGVTDSGNTFSQADLIEPVLVFMVIYFVRLAGSFTASYMFDSIASESHDRTLEILITTVSPLQFITGKLLGLIAVGLTQIGMWVGAILALGVAVSLFLGVNFLAPLFSWDYLSLMISVLLAAYFLDQILAAAMGLLRISGGAGNLFFNTINAVVGISLIYAIYFVPRNPNTLPAVLGSLFPLTAPLVLLIRVVVTEVPVWQIALSQILLWGTCLLGIIGLRKLLKANLVAGSSLFSLRAWFARQLAGLRARTLFPSRQR